jgi:hypothetical protein
LHVFQKKIKKNLEAFWHLIGEADTNTEVDAADDEYGEVLGSGV